MSYPNGGFPPIIYTELKKKSKENNKNNEINDNINNTHLPKKELKVENIINQQFNIKPLIELNNKDIINEIEELY